MQYSSATRKCLFSCKSPDRANELHKLLGQMRKNDVRMVWKLDRLSRSLRDVLTIMDRIQEKKAGFRSLTEAVDTTTPAGRMMMQMVGAFAEFERAMLKERTHAGLDAARKEGRIGGRPPKLKAQQRLEIVKLVTKGRRPRRMPHACSAFIQLLCRGYCVKNLPLDRQWSTKYKY
jgi:DNA invertase Pin-like site-specific DNA recombinase